MSADSRLGALKLPITSLSPKISEGRVADDSVHLVQPAVTTSAPLQLPKSRGQDRHLGPALTD
jgi:hypothetical protein